MSEEPPTQSVNRTVRAPFWYEDIKSWISRSQMGRKIKFLGLVGLIIVGIYFMFQWFGGWFLLGFISLPAWYFWALRQIDRDSYTLIEVRLEGDQLSETSFSDDTQLSMYSIPPDLWREMKKEGTPFSPGQRMYICDFFDEKKQKIIFPHDKRFSNLNFWSRLTLWMKLKQTIPALEKELAILMYDMESKATERAIEILTESGRYNKDQAETLRKATKPRLKRLQKEVAYIEQ